MTIENLSEDKKGAFELRSVDDIALMLKNKSVFEVCQERNKRTVFIGFDFFEIYFSLFFFLITSVMIFLSYILDIVRPISQYSLIKHSREMH